MTAANLRSEIETILASMANRSAIRLPILDGVGNPIGWLDSVTADDLADTSLIADLTSWRNANRRFFLTQFEANEERTYKWLQQTVVGDPSRILFIIKTDTDLPVGHLGVLRLDTNSPELDNMIRGRSGGDLQLMLYAEVAVITWCFRNPLVHSICLNVFSNNWLPIGVHRSIGFEPGEIRKLSKLTEGGQVTLLVESDEGEQQRFGLLRMSLKKENFRLGNLPSHNAP